MQRLLTRRLAARQTWRQQFALLSLAGTALLVSACGGGSSGGSAPEVAINDTLPVDNVQSGRLLTSEDERTLSFTIAEDSVLSGLFSDAEGDAEAQGMPADASDTFFNTRFTILSLPQYGLLTLNADGSVFRYEPEANYWGMDTFNYLSADGSETMVSITITAVPDAPVFDTELPKVADQGRLLSIELQASDADGDELRYSASNLPEWLTFDSRSQLLSGVPRQTDVGTIDTIVLNVADGTGLFDTIDYQLEVVDINDPPAMNLTQVPSEFYARDTVSFSVFPDDPDDDRVTVEVVPHDAFTAIVDDDEITLTINDIKQVSSTQLTIIARDELGASSREQIPVSLFPVTESGNGVTVSGYSEGPGINIVILGDGYTADQMDTFRQHVDGVLENIRSDKGIADHLGAFNIHRIETVSRESGADDIEGEDIVDTAFNSSFNCNGVPRLLCAENIKVFEVALSEYPNADQFVLLVNDIRFGGSGNSNGRLAITSARFPQIALHEMGHSLANLADEYEDINLIETNGLAPFEEGSFKNVSNLSDPERVPWAHWIDPQAPLPQFFGDKGVGVFEGGHYRSTGVYRPTFESRMREFNQPFGPVNTEQWILRLYTLTDGIRELQPRAQAMLATAGELQEFIVEPIFGFDAQAITWELNGEPLIPDTLLADDHIDVANADSNAAGRDATMLSETTAQDDDIQSTANSTLSRLLLSLPPGQHELTVTVSDITGKIRVSEPHAGIFSWTWTITAL